MSKLTDAKRGGGLCGKMSDILAAKQKWLDEKHQKIQSVYFVNRNSQVEI